MISKIRQSKFLPSWRFHSSGKDDSMQRLYNIMSSSEVLAKKYRMTWHGDKEDEVGGGWGTIFKRTWRRWQIFEVITLKTECATWAKTLRQKQIRLSPGAARPMWQARNGWSKRWNWQFQITWGLVGLQKLLFCVMRSQWKVGQKGDMIRCAFLKDRPGYDIQDRWHVVQVNAMK